MRVRDWIHQVELVVEDTYFQKDGVNVGSGSKYFYVYFVSEVFSNFSQLD